MSAVTDDHTGIGRTTVLRLADAEFSTRLLAVGRDDWHRPTPCADWSVRQLVGHVVSGSAMSAAIVRGTTRIEAIAILGIDHLGVDPVAAYRRILDEQHAAFDAAPTLDQMCEHPAGDMTVAQLLDFRIGDLVVHAWDLAVALDLDPTLHPDVVQHVWSALQPMAPFIGQLGVFGSGATGAIAAAAPLQDRLLDLTGRRPGAAA